MYNINTFNRLIVKLEKTFGKDLFQLIYQRAIQYSERHIYKKNNKLFCDQHNAIDQLDVQLLDKENSDIGSLIHCLIHSLSDLKLK